MLAELQNSFSINTAEELFAAAAASGDHLQDILGLDEFTWDEIMERVSDALDPNVRELLAEPLPSPYGKGAVLKRNAKLPVDYEKYLA